MRLRTPRRRGAAVVEAAFVLPIALLLLLGVFEYCRFVFLVQVAENAAREGARYASARTGDGTTSTDVTTYVTDKLAGRAGDLTGLTITLAYVDPNTGTTISGSNWNDAPFSGSIMVRISGTYSPLLTSFLKMPASVPVQATSIMGSEAN